MKVITSYLIRQRDLKPCSDFNLQGVPVCRQPASSAHSLQASRCWSGPCLGYFKVLWVLRQLQGMSLVLVGCDLFLSAGFQRAAPGENPWLGRWNKLQTSVWLPRLGDIPWEQAPSVIPAEELINCSHTTPQTSILPPARSDPHRSQPVLIHPHVYCRPQSHRGCSWSSAAAERRWW